MSKKSKPSKCNCDQVNSIIDDILDIEADASTVLTALTRSIGIICIASEIEKKDAINTVSAILSEMFDDFQRETKEKVLQ